MYTYLVYCIVAPDVHMLTKSWERFRVGWGDEGTRACARELGLDDEMLEKGRRKGGRKGRTMDRWDILCMTVEDRFSIYCIISI